VRQGQSLVVFAPGLFVRVYDTATWEKRAEWKISEGPPVYFGPSVLSPDQKFLVTGVSGSVEFRNLLTGEVESTVAAQNWGVSGLAFAPNGALLAISSIDGTVNLWDAAERKQVDVLRGHLLGVHAVAFSPDGERLATISHGNEAVKLWDVQTRHEVATLAGQGSFFTHARFSPDGRLLAALNRQRTAYIWRAPSREEIAAAEAQETSGGSR
jgi:WD40 repeat protein